MIQNLKSLPKSLVSGKNIKKNINTNGLSPENQNREHAQITKNCWSNLQAPTLKNHHFILVTYFNVIPIGEIPQTPLV